MAKISLRAYTHEIEGLISKGQLDEAVVHCQYILQMYPKLLAAYRLLGKAYLDGQRYGDAADVFLRVLSAAPDDFTAHVGMSVIREDEGNLNAALWHMERAFEVQPSNGAIQGELRRLYGRRDGVEPPKIRMTRGALARMYARGNLYQQAIAELRTALAEDPQRPDLQVLLARMYFLAGQRVEAVDTCSALIKRLPYCLEANRLLSHILPETGRKEDSQTYAQRVAALDPYLVYAKPGSPTGNEVSENIVMLDRTDFLRARPAAEAPSQPAWAASLGVSVDQFSSKEEESLPEWLSGDARVVDKAEASSESMQPEDEVADNSESLIPDWMKQAGWEPGTGETDEGQTFEESELPEDQGEISPGDVPDWLKTMAPSGVMEDLVEKQSPGELSSEEVPSWLQEETPGESGTISNLLSDEEPQTPESESLDIFPPEGMGTGETPDWLKEASQEEEHETHPSDEFIGEGIIADTPVDDDFIAEEAIEEPSESGIPDWLKEMQPTEEQQPAAEKLPDWLNELNPEESQAEQGILPNWLSEPSEDIEEIIHEEPRLEESTAELNLVGEEQPAEESSIPEWLKEMEPEVVDEQTTEFIEEFHADISPIELAEEVATAPAIDEATLGVSDEASLPDWLQEPGESGSEILEDTSIKAVPGEAPLPTDLTDAEVGLAWLESLAAKQGVPEEELTTRPEDRSVEIPDWIKEEGTDLAAADIISGPEKTEPETIIPADEPSQMMSDEFESEEPELSFVDEESPAIPSEEIPDWLKAMAVDTPAQPVIESAPDEEPSPIETLPDWLSEEHADEQRTQETIPPAEPAVDMPDWLKEIEGEDQEETITSEVTEIELPGDEATQLEGKAEPAIDIPDWLEQIDTEVPESEEVQAEFPVTELPSLDMPEMVTPEIPAESIETLPPASAPDLSDADAALAWLESLAAKQGVPEEELISKPEERPVEAPEWIQEVKSGETPTPEMNDLGETPVFAEIEETIPQPEWLKEMEAELGEESVPVSEPSAGEIVEISAESEGTEITEAEIIEPETAPSGENVDEALAWLESLAAKQGVPQQELISNPEDRPTEVPAWAMETEEAVDSSLAIEETGDEVQTGFDELKEAEAAADAIIRAAAQTGMLVMPPSEITGVDVPLKKPEPVELTSPDLAEPAETSKVIEPETTPVEIPDWISQAAETPAQESWSPPEVVKAEVEPIPAVNINSGSLVDLESLPGIGFVMAQNILNYREEHGDFSSVDDLANVPGFFPELIDEIRQHLTIEEHKAAPPPAAPVTTTGPDLELVQQARSAISAGNKETALEIYNQLIKNNSAMDDVIYDLNLALRSQPKDPLLWQTLGDAYMYSDRLQEALDAYNQAEENLR